MLGVCGNDSFLIEAVETFEVLRYVPSFRATPHTSCSLKLSCTVSHVYLAKQARAMADLAQLDVGDCNPPAVQGSVM